MTTRRRPEKPLTKQAIEFVRHHLADKGAFAPFTGTDWDAWNAYIPAVRLWGRMRDHETAAVLRGIVRCAQPNADVLACFKKAIPCLLDWSDEFKLWNQIKPSPSPRAQGNINMPCPNGARICHHERSKPYAGEGGYQECRDCGAVWKHTEASREVTP